MIKLPKKIHLIAFIIIGVISILTAQNYSASAEWQGRVSKVSDGDTIWVVKKDGSREKIRLYGIDTPEMDQPHGIQSREFLAHRINNKIVRVRQKDEDQYGRIVGVIYLKDNCLNKTLVKKGQAWVYDRYCRMQTCKKWKRLEEQARHARHGLWKRENPVPPWDWRHKD